MFRNPLEERGGGVHSADAIIIQTAKVFMSNGICYEQSRCTTMHTTARSARGGRGFQNKFLLWRTASTCSRIAPQSQAKPQMVFSGVAITTALSANQQGCISDTDISCSQTKMAAHVAHTVQQTHRTAAMRCPRQ